MPPLAPVAYNVGRWRVGRAPALHGMAEEEFCFFRRVKYRDLVPARLSRSACMRLVLALLCIRSFAGFYNA